MEVREAVPAAEAWPAPLRLRITPPTVVESGEARDLAALATALFELGAADLPTVVPSIVGRGPALGLSDVPTSGAELWTVTLSYGSAPTRLSWTVCDPTGTCRPPGEHPVLGRRVTPAVAAALQATAVALLHPGDADTVAAWSAPPSADPYAVLLAGRAAAVLYGTRPPVPLASVGNERKDPVARTLLVDPTVSVAGWVAARRDVATGELDAAMPRLIRAGLGRPTSVAIAAADAATRSLRGEPRLAWTVWQGLTRRRQADARFIVPAARAAMAVGALDDAEALLAHWPPERGDAPAVARIHAELAALRGRPSEQLDAYLAAWQRVAPEDPEPVRRRIQLRIARDAYAEAAVLAQVLEQRGASSEAHRLLVALAASQGQWDQVARQADDLGLAGTAWRARRRISPPLTPPPRDDGWAWLDWARSQLAAGDTAGASASLGVASKLLGGAPEVVALRRQVSPQKQATPTPQGPSFVVVGPSTSPGASAAGSQAHGAVE